MTGNTLIVLVGPTASGKSAMAVRLAMYYRTEIISADSRQVFRELDKGTAKPTDAELSTVKHHLINSHSIHDPLDAADYGKEARKIIDEIFRRQNMAILCGGSGLYIKAVLEGFDEMPTIPQGIRHSVAAEVGAGGLEWLQKEVSRVDPDYYEVVDRQNPQRLMRAIEVYRASGVPFSAHRKKEQLVLPFKVIKLGLCPPREQLYERIDQRMDDMIRDGLFEEAERLFPLRHLNALQTVGYQEIFGYLEGQYDKAEAIRLLKRNSRRYAKRQMTWFRRDASVRWFLPEDWNGIVSCIEETISGNHS
ncbi:MAG: tRNA (adenosine(37)-N6)-dimethylallyltransferase MiaA [Bacteroidetes bacterium]|nr:tRNA (adenosine(37)-N6)-dimethylallyltransferase MiaA [Bacteroidota bacterium]